MNDLEKIKKFYGEKMMHLCRNLFSTLLEQDNLLFNLIESNFAPSKYLYDDIVNKSLEIKFKNYIYSLIDVEKKKIEIRKTPQELLKELGYNLYECKTEEDIQKFKKYYANNEKLCTFHGGRLNKCYVFFAVKKNVDEIKRENFLSPERRDEYGTSVISIQFSKGEVNTLSIKNRYNHRVNNPDATFSNNLDNIIPGLTQSFEEKYNLNINQNDNRNFELPGYIKASDGKYYKYNYEINNVYYCPNNIIIDNFEVKKEYLQKEKYLIIDYFVIDLVNKNISLYDNTINDSFIDGLTNVQKIEITKNNENKIIKIIFKNNDTSYIKVDKYNRIIKYENQNIEQIKNNFLYYNKELTEINLPNVCKINNNFLAQNLKLKKINIENVQIIGNNFLFSNKCFKKIVMPQVLIIGDSFLVLNEELEEIYLPKVRIIGNDCLFNNNRIKEIYLPNVEIIENDFFFKNEVIEKIEIPNVVSIGNNFLFKNKKILKINTPNLNEVGYRFLESSKTSELKVVLKTR